jgi:hypothetical protein
VLGEEPSMTQAGRVSQVDIVIAADELEQRLRQCWPAVASVPGGYGHAEVTFGGECDADLPEVLSPHVRVQAAVYREVSQHAAQELLEAVKAG